MLKPVLVRLGNFLVFLKVDKGFEYPEVGLNSLLDVGVGRLVLKFVRVDNHRKSEEAVRSIQDLL